MLSNRQIKILGFLDNQKDGYLTAGNLAKLLEISVRTVQSELSSIKAEIEKLSFVCINSVPSKGYTLTVTNREQFNNYIQSSDSDEGLNDKDERIKRIIDTLFCSQYGITATHLADRLFISRSTLISDLKFVKRVLDKYNIEIVTNSHSGIYVKGDESDKRRCISKENINTFNLYSKLIKGGTKDYNFKNISKMLANIFTDYRYSISDVALQNLIVHVNILVQRIKKGFYMKNVRDIDYDEFKLEFEMARILFDKLHQLYAIPVLEAEIINIAIHFKGKCDFYDDVYITAEIDDFVFEALEIIQNEFGIDLLDNVQLRLSLSLHLVPLLTRLRYNMQQRNEMLNTMRQDFQLAFDIASSFAYSITNKYGYSLIEDEVSFLAIYFKVATSNHRQLANGKKVLIISSLKRSESLLLRERINYWFEDKISQLEISNIIHIQHDISQYDLVLTTEENVYSQREQAILINRYPNDEDYRLIKSHLDGFNSNQDFINLFDESCFIKGTFKDKYEVISKLCLCGENSEELQEAVVKREKMGGTYFGGGIAVPHPMFPIANKTFICVAILDKPMVWDEHGNKIEAVILLVLQKNNTQIFKTWTYLSNLLSKSNFYEELKTIQNYNQFIKLIYKSLEQIHFNQGDFFE